MNNTIFRKIINWLLLLVSLALLGSGYAITHYSTAQKLTAGIFSKAFFFEAHSKLSPIFIILILLHILRIRKK